jgi:hypothetical protein
MLRKALPRAMLRVLINDFIVIFFFQNYRF